MDKTVKRPLPTKAQQEWADMELGVLIHYDIPVFSPDFDFRKRWGDPLDVSIFNPTMLDTDQWLSTAAAAGAKYAVLVAKHCSGFSLWQTEAHDYSVKSSPWRDGKGDIVGDFIKSCKKFGIKPGLYYSVACNGYFCVDNPGTVLSGNEDEQKAYNEMVIKQVTELWTNYGELFEIWFDGGALPPEKRRAGCSVPSVKISAECRMLPGAGTIPVHFTVGGQRVGPGTKPLLEHHKCGGRRFLRDGGRA